VLVANIPGFPELFIGRNCWVFLIPVELVSGSREFVRGFVGCSPLTEEVRDLFTEAIVPLGGSLCAPLSAHNRELCVVLHLRGGH
jgi:hypothetical protein